MLPVRTTRENRAGVIVSASVLAVAALAACGSSSKPASVPVTNAVPRDTARVLLVGTFHGHAGQYQTIQSAVDAARAGDWILVAPGDYHEDADTTGPESEYVAAGGFGGVYIDKPNIHLRGMNRTSVIVDGTTPGASACSANPADQTYGRVGSDGKAEGRNGILVWQANGVSVDNLTVCNFLAGSRPSGNEIWWNGGAESAKIGLHGYSGSYLDRDVDLPRHQRDRSAVRDLLVELGRPRRVGEHLREQLQRLRHVRGRVSPGLQHQDRPRLAGVQTRSAIRAPTPVGRS